MSESPEQNTQTVRIRVVHRDAPEAPTRLVQPRHSTPPETVAAKADRERAQGVKIPAFLEVTPGQFVPTLECTPEQIAAVRRKMLREARKLTDTAAALQEVARRIADR